MKKLIIAIFCLFAMNCYSIEYEVILKEWAQSKQVKLKNEGHKILDITPLDTEKNGYVKISYQ